MPTLIEKCVCICLYVHVSAFFFWVSMCYRNPGNRGSETVMFITSFMYYEWPFSAEASVVSGYL